jgi:Protein of unknown function (DUF3108)
MIRSWTLVVGLMAVLVAAGATQAREQKERLLFDVMFGGLHVADVVVSMDQTPESYQSRLEMRTRGVAELFQDFRADMKSEGGFVTAGAPVRTVPTLYSRAWSGPKMASEMTMQFDPLTGFIPSQERLFNPLTGAALTQEDMPWNNRRKPIPVVPDNLRAGALDPVAAFIAARRQVLDSGTGEVRVPIYDGRRRYDIISRVGKSHSYTIKDQTRELTPVTSRVEPVFGFEPDAEDRMRESTGTTLFSSDDRFVPVQIILANDMFSSVMNLVAECTTDPAPCDNFGQKATQSSASN